MKVLLVEVAIALVASIVFVALFITLLQFLAEMFESCWMDAGSCWFVPRYPLPQP